MERCKGHGWLTSLGVFGASVCLLAVTWLVMEPQALYRAFDHDGRSVVELLALPLYAAIVPFVWWKCPFTGSRLRRNVLCAAVSCVAVMAILKQTDAHVALLAAAYPDVVANFKGTPFKMRFLTSGVVPAGAKCFVVAYFVLFFGVFAALLAYFARAFVCGVFALHPAAWSVGCLGASGVMVQLCDRMPAWIRHARGLPKSAEIDGVRALFTALEEGGEVMIAVFALLAIGQAFARKNVAHDHA